MKHSFSVTAAALLLTAVLVIGLYAAFGTAEASGGESESLSAARPAKEGQIPSPAEDKMLLKTFDGKLALFLGGGRYPAKVYDLLVRSLPAEDQLLLKSGIEVSSDEELKRLLEDFLS